MQQAVKPLLVSRPYLLQLLQSSPGRVQLGLVSGRLLGGSLCFEASLPLLLPQPLQRYLQLLDPALRRQAA